MGEIHLYDIIQRPIITEKTQRLMEFDNVYTFEVDKRADKRLVKNAVESIFDVDVVKVRTVIMPAKRGRRFRKTYIRKKEWKKAYVTVAPVQNIDLFGL